MCIIDFQYSKFWKFILEPPEQTAETVMPHTSARRLKMWMSDTEIILIKMTTED